MVYENPGVLFEGTAERYASYRPGHPREFFDILEASLVPGGAVLDLGCGPGTLALELAQRGRDVLAVDANIDMLHAGQEAAAERGLSERIEWLHRDAHDLNGIGDVGAAVIGDAFHWLDRKRVLDALDRLLPADGLVALFMSFALGTAKPWWFPYADRVIERHLGPRRFAGPNNHYREPEGGSHETVLRGSAFEQVLSVRTDRTLRFDLDALMEHQYTQAYSSPAVLGDKRDAFDTDLRELLTAAEPSGVFCARTCPAMIVARRLKEDAK